MRLFLFFFCAARRVCQAVSVFSPDEVFARHGTLRLPCDFYQWHKYVHNNMRNMHNNAQKETAQTTEQQQQEQQCAWPSVLYLQRAPEITVSFLQCTYQRHKI